jgi:hypothetical protein
MWFWLTHAVLGLARTGTVEVVVGRTGPCSGSAPHLGRRQAPRVPSPQSLPRRRQAEAAAESIAWPVSASAELGLVLIENIYKASEAAGRAGRSSTS